MSCIYAENEMDILNNDTPVEIKTYTDLNNEIDSCEDSTLNLTDNYKYDLENDEYLDGGVGISKSITINGKNNTYIDGSNLARGLYISSNCNVILKDLTIKNCYSTSGGAGILLGYNSNLTLINCIFQNNKVYNSNGGCIKANSQTNVEIDKCQFINNTSIRESDLAWNKFKCGMGSAIFTNMGSTLKLSNSKFVDNIGHVSTVILISSDDVINEVSTLYMENCLFEKNTGNDCGIVYMDELGQCEILNSVFKNNKIVNNGGILDLDAVFPSIVKNCLFEENSVTVGGGIHVKVNDDAYVSHVSIYDCNFTKNTILRDGGAIFSRYGDVNVTNCNFNQNTAPRYGGAIYINYGSMNILNSKFTQNKAENGGGIFVINSDSVKAVDCNFNQNTASRYGGAIYIKDSSLNVINSKFTQNKAVNGGGIFVVNSKANIKSSSFTKNIASDNAGAIYTLDSTIDISGSDFNRNSAKRGGALILKHAKNTVSSSIFNNNIASEKGGVIYLSEGSLKITNSKFSQNTAQDGGALYADDTSVSVSSASFNKNHATNKGGAIYSKIKDVAASKCTFTGNSAKFGDDVYGLFYATVKQYTHTTSSVKLVVKLTSPWKSSLTQQIYIKITGPKSYTSKWVKTNSKGEASIIVPYNINIAKSKIQISIKNGITSVKSWTKIKDKAIIKSSKTVKKSSTLKVTVLNKATKKAIKNTKCTVKVYTGKKYTTFKIKSTSKGILNIPTKKISKGKHDIVIILKNNNYDINNKFSIKIK